MKKMLILLLAAVLLVGCTPKEPDELLNYPGLQWGMTFEEVAEVLHISEDQILNVRDDLDAAQPQVLYEVAGLKLFDRDTSLVGLRFHVYGDQAPGLCEMLISYPEDTDREALVTDLQEIYGEPGGAMTLRQWDWYANKMVEREYPVPDGSTRWNSRRTFLDSTPLEVLEAGYDRQVQHRAEAGITEFPTFEQYLTLGDHSVATVTLYKSFTGQYQRIPCHFSEEEIARGWTDTVLVLYGKDYLYAKNMTIPEEG